MDVTATPGGANQFPGGNAFGGVQRLRGALLGQPTVRVQIQRKASHNFAATVRTINVPAKQQRAVTSGFVQGFRS